MKINFQKGATDITGIVILVVIIMIMLVSPKNPSSNSGTDSTWDWTSGTTISNTGNNTQTTNSNYSSLTSLSSGNASYSYQSYEEYITLENRGASAVNITGWQLRNGKDKRTYNQGGSLQRFSADVAVIPQGTLIISPIGNPHMTDIVLSAGERAIITTGAMALNSPYRTTGFKENMCTGYIEALPEYSFTPALSQNCPRPALEAGVSSLDTECRNFINGLSSCRTPEFNAKTPDGLGTCATCVNGKILSSSCFAFIKEHYNYQGCLANHSSDTNFSSRTWRVFLGRGWEMWAKEYETIELYDRLGQLVNFQNY